MQVPMAATVYCQPIQMRTERVLGFDMAQANQWRWRNEYEGLDLAHIRQEMCSLPNKIAAAGHMHCQACAVGSLVSAAVDPLCCHSDRCFQSNVIVCMPGRFGMHDDEEVPVGAAVLMTFDHAYMIMQCND